MNRFSQNPEQPTALFTDSEGGLLGYNKRCESSLTANSFAPGERVER